MAIHSRCIGILPRFAKAQAEAKGCRWFDVPELQGEPLKIGVAWDKAAARSNPASGDVLQWLLG